MLGGMRHIVEQDKVMLNDTGNIAMLYTRRLNGCREGGGRGADV